jgi:hypothetical protein
MILALLGSMDNFVALKQEIESKLSVCAVTLLLMGCANSMPLEYYKEDQNAPQQKKDFIECGGVEVKGQMTYLPTTLPMVDSCLRKKGYNVSLAPRIAWEREGTSSVEFRRDAQECGIVFRILDGRPEVHQDKLAATNECMISRGYAPTTMDEVIENSQ